MDVTDETKKIYSETRNDLLNRHLSNTEAFDKAVLSLSSAGLGVSLAFIKDIVPIHTIINIRLLYISWLCFANRKYNSDRTILLMMDRIFEVDY